MGKGGDGGPTDAPVVVPEEPLGSGVSGSLSVPPECMTFVKERIRCPGITPEMWSAEHDDTISEFLTTPTQRRLLAFVDPVLGLSLQFSLPQEAVADLTYVLKPSGAVISAENISKTLQFGSVRGAPVSALLRLMSGAFVPLCLKDESWPDTIKKEFSGQLQKFMASLTETAWDAQGKTMLYIPMEPIGTAEAAAKQKDLVQRLESTLIHWTRQIKEVLNRQDDGEDTEDAGPLAEVQFWSSRTIDLSGIHEQLERAEVAHIVAVLEQAKSSYLPPFLKLSQLIQEGTSEAVDNLKFLKNLQEPCLLLAEASPHDIPAILPSILNVIRLVWKHSRFYNTADRLTGLLRKVSNEIINRCRASISLPEILDGDVQKEAANLQCSIEACESWLALYAKTAAAVEREKAESGREWDLDMSSIFAQLNAFVQRCRDLQEVCEGQTQFARRAEGGATAPLPDFGGSRGPEVSSSLLSIQTSFEKNIAALRGLAYDILDVKATATLWHNDYNTTFKSGMKDLEVMFQNVITNAFEGAATTHAQVELLEAFSSLARRDSITRAVEKKASEVCDDFQLELTRVKSTFDKLKGDPPAIHRDHPRFAGAALWAKSLHSRVSRQWELLDAAQAYLPPTREAEEAAQLFAQLEGGLDEYIRKMYSEWIATIDAGMGRHLENYLMVRSSVPLAGSSGRERYGFLEQNFDKALLGLFSEVHYWERLHFEIPYVAMDITAHRERYRTLRENVMLVVRDYNTILSALSPPERRLFSENLHKLDKKIAPGLSKLSWVSKGVTEVFVKDLRRFCAEVNRLVHGFHHARKLIGRSSRGVAATPLVLLKKKQIYAQDMFESEQQAHQEHVRAKLQTLHLEMRGRMVETYGAFRDGGDDVQREWNSFVEQIDRQVEDSLRQTVKKSLQELSRSINGDAKTEVQPLFQIHVTLQGSKVEFKPSIAELTQSVNSVSKEAIATTSAMPRQAEALREGGDDELKGAAGTVDAKPTFYMQISNDEDILKVLVQVMTGMREIQPRLSKYLTTWDRYKHIWDVDKDAFMRRYAKANRALTAFETDITRYKELQHDIQSEEGITNVGFIRIDSSPLKQALVAHCHTWQNKFTQLLNNNAATELRTMYDHMEEVKSSYKKRPVNLDQLAEQIHLLEAEEAAFEKTESRFEPLETQYRLLEKFEVAVKEVELAQLAGLKGEWQSYRKMLSDVSVRLQKAKADFKDDLLSSLNAFNDQTAGLRTDFLRNAPFDGDIPPTKARELIAEYRGNAAGVRTREKEMAAGLQIFSIEPPANKDTAQTEKELDLLDAVWTMLDEWVANLDGWKTGKFKDMDVDQIETVAGQFAKRVYKLGKEIKGWKVLESLKERVDNMKKLMPLIGDLRNPAMRERHWQELMGEVGKTFDPHSEGFTLETVIALGLEHYQETITTLSTAAGKELAIEEAIAKIEVQWESLPLDLADYKGEYLKLRSVDDLYSALEDNAVGLSTMKASRFAAAFQATLEQWEKALSHISETVEMIMGVQRKWMYLESIFVGSEDIRKQLPSESALFDDVNAAWKKSTSELAEAGTAFKGTHIDGMLERLVEMDDKLDRIQKSLDEYLETKRQAFPRFYFLSNDDLLEILGQARDPLAVQPHVRKCFECIKTLEIKEGGKEGRKSYEVVGMNSPERELVQMTTTVTAGGPVEVWLLGVETAMCSTLAATLFRCYADMKKTKREKWIKDWPGQMTLTSGQVAWTVECTKALHAISDGTKSAMRQAKKKQANTLTKLCDMVRGNLDGLSRKKVVNIVTIEVHARDVIDRMIKGGCASVNDFEWLLQLRFYWEQGSERCVVRQTNTTHLYGYEYLGNVGRLVITPLTDRCYTTLTTALHLHRGGLPQGPAGTGKTETVKDLAKSLAKQCIVFNCSDGLDYKSLGRMFSGLAQTGAWSCFDEFNRIEVEVLSVVAQQILSILTAITQQKKRFVFEGREIKLDPTCGIFVTMNPGYAGRSELPENLKALLRPMSMMTPDISLIIEIMLFSEGFQTSKMLSKKMTTLYHLMVQQLSKQDHYDFGLRSVKSVLNSAGALKRADTENTSEDVILLRSIRDMNLPKFVSQDMPLFNGLMSDLFPGVEPPVVDYGALQLAIEAELEAAGLQLVPAVVRKCIQTYESKLTRHGNMMVGPSLGGKSTAWKILIAAMCRLRRDGVNQNDGSPFQNVKAVVINPKAVPYANLYGEYDLQTFEWTDGVLSKVMREVCADEKPDEKWLLMDGPVDTLWIESMNTVLDDNKLLTLINGERIAMPPQVSLLFEVEDLSVASPATVSRAGMVYVDATDLGWTPFVESWLAKQEEGPARDKLRALVDSAIPKLLGIKAAKLKAPVPVSDLGEVRSLCGMYDAMATAANGVSTAEGPEAYLRMIEMWFLYCLMWSLGIATDEDGRKEVDGLMRELDAQFPHKDSVYEYHIDVKKRAWAHWEEKLSAAFRIAPDLPFYKIVVPTVDTLRYGSVVANLVKAGKNVLVTGAVGVGKTSIVVSALSNGLDDGFTFTTINFSAQTKSTAVSDGIEQRIEKRTKDTFAPPGGKKLVAFIDDFNMPEKEVFGAQPPLEILRQFMTYAFWYDLKKQTPKYIKDTQSLASMGHPGGGRQPISPRTLHCFHVLNMTFPNDASIKRIFGAMINSHLATFDEEIKPLGDLMTAATLEIYLRLAADLLPTPDKPHYLFNLRDISRVFQGVLQSDKDHCDSRDGMLRLWVHEMNRAFSDRFTNTPDKDFFDTLLDEKLTASFQSGLKAIYKTEPMPFGDFMVEAPEGKRAPYEEITDKKALKTFMEEKLEDLNMEPGVQVMDLVMFSDAISHVTRIKRIISMPRSHAMLVGVGGSGRQSLTKLASYIGGYKVFTIEVVRGYRSELFHEDLKKLYEMTGINQTPTVFLFNDTQVIENSFLEDINGMLTSGEVNNLYAPDEKNQMQDAMRDEVIAAGLPTSNDNLWAAFVERVRKAMHIVVCCSPVGESFRNYVRMFPALVSCTTIDWFSDWPADALKEVALRFLEDVQIAPEHLDGVSTTFAQTQTSVLVQSKSMLARLGRPNYVTPTNYLELVKGYCKLLGEKRQTVGDQAYKLKNGLQKLSDTAEQVAEMSIELEQKKKVVAKAQTDCEEMLVVIVQEKRIVDEQQKNVNAESEKIGKEEAETKIVADDAQADLDKAIPALDAAQKALEMLNKKDMAEVKAYAKPPKAVETTMEAVMVLRKSDPTWAEAKKQLGDPNFLMQLVNFDKDSLVDSVLNKVNKYTREKDFDPEIVGNVSKAAKSLCMWVRAMEVYGRIAKEVAPKRAKLQGAMKSLATKQAQLQTMQVKVKEISDKVLALREKYTDNVNNKEKLKNESESLEIKLDRAKSLVDGLGGERVRWEGSITVLETSLGNLVGDCLLAAAFLSYCGPFDSAYREVLLQDNWLKSVKTLNIPASPDFEFCDFLAKPEDVRDWNIQGLPADSFSTENGVMVTRGTRWPLMIDPQEQANKWVKNMEKENGLKVVTLKQADYLRTLENAITFGQPVLMQEVEQELDPSLEPIMSRAVIKVGNRQIMKLGDKEVDYNVEFRFYLTTKLPNPHYTPEISTKATIVNFCVKQQGLEEQLLGTVVRKERPELEMQKNDLVVAVAAGKRKLVELEDTILRMLSSATGSLLDDEELVLTLQSSKTTSIEVTNQLAVSEQTEKKIDAAREGYRPCAYRASILYFLLSDLARVDPMYQFSLDAYVQLFVISLDKSARSDELQERIKNLNEYHTFFVYRSTCRALFEMHKLLFSFQITAKIMLGAKKMNQQEHDFFLRGGQVFDKSEQPPNPCSDWISETAWDNITELDKLPNFRNIMSSFESSARDWREWYRHPEPETPAARLPGEWENRCSEMQRCIIVRCLRPDRIVFATTLFIVNNLGAKFTEPPVLDLNNVLADSMPTTPLIFVLSPGVDPTNQLLQLSEQKGVTFTTIALGQGQSPHALRLIDNGVKDGHWVLLANCHLMMSWLNELDKIIESMPTRSPHSSFRLWLSSSPHPQFPIGILQRGIKMTTEPPKGLKANMSRLMNNFSEGKFSSCQKPHKYKKLLYALCWFHSILVDRRKFQNLGWNIPYDFNDSDFEVSELCLRLYLDEYDETPWDALKYLVSEINYGGRVTDDNDRRLMNVYVSTFFNEDALAVPQFKLSPLASYVIPEDGPLSSYREVCAGLPQIDKPEAFGQHPNADIASQIVMGTEMLGTIVSLQPRNTDAGGTPPEELVYEIADNLLNLIPEPVDPMAKAGPSDGSALHVVLVQEMQRYCALLGTIRKLLINVKKGIKGLVVMSADLDAVFQKLLVGAVPPAWLSAYPSLKPLASWSRDLIARWQQLIEWCDKGPPKVFWLAGFTYPTGMLTALMQTAARTNNVSVDTLAWDFPIVNVEEKDVTAAPKDGAYVRGLFLEGAGWNWEHSCLCEPEAMELIYPMPIIHFKPVESKKSKTKGMYASPLYLYPLRTGSRERPSFMLPIELKSGTVEPEFWTKRGTALLLALAE